MLFVQKWPKTPVGKDHIMRVKGVVGTQSLFKLRVLVLELFISSSFPSGASQCSFTSFCIFL